MNDRPAAVPWHSRYALRWVVAALCVVLGGVAGLVLHQALPRAYTASTSVLVLPTAGGVEAGAGSRSATEVRIETEAQVAHSAQVADIASKALKGSVSPAELLKNASVFVPSNSQVLVIDYEATTPQGARDGSRALSTAYLDRRSQQAAAEKDAVVKSLEQQLADLTTRLQQNAATLAAVPTTDGGARALAEAQRNLLVDQISEVNTRLVGLRFQTTTGGEIITAAPLPSRATSPVLVVTLGAGLVVGALAAAGVLLLLDRRQKHRERRARDVLVASGIRRLPTVSLAPHRQPSAAGGGDVPGPSESRALRILCDDIRRFDAALGPTAVIGVLEPSLRASFVQQLAVALGGRTEGALLVVTEHGPHAQALGAAPGQAGFADAVQGKPTAEVVSTGPDGVLRVMAPGSGLLTLDPAAHSSVLTSLWSRLEREFGVVVVDVASPFGSSIAQAVLATAGRIVVAVDDRHADGREMLGALEALEIIGLSDRVVGVVGVTDTATRRLRARHAKPAATEVVVAPRSTAKNEKDDVPVASDDDSQDELASDPALTRPGGQFDGS